MNYGQFQSHVQCTSCMDRRNKDRVKTYTEEQLKPENTIYHVYKKDGRRVYHEDLHLDRERNVTVCGVSIGTLIGSLEEMINIGSHKGVEKLEKSQLQERIEFWKGRRLPNL